jgi:hypothetical protein
MAGVCHEETIYLPLWSDNLCWFLSLNIGLFHRPNPILQKYIQDYDEAGKDEERKAYDCAS